LKRKKEAVHYSINVRATEGDVYILIDYIYNDEEHHAASRFDNSNNDVRVVHIYI
jgi:hypothetical protein